jgi:drug/metabolite transporter (DMT)-like permease
MNWIVLSIFAGIASSAFSAINRIALKDKGDSTAYGWWFEVVRSIFFITIVLRNPFPELDLNSLTKLILVSFSEMFSVYVFMRMHALTELSVSSIISRLRIVWSPLIAWLVINERLTSVEYLGIIIIFLGIAIVSSPSEIKKDKGIKFALLFSFSSALLSTLVKNASVNLSSEIIILSQGIVPIILLPILMKSRFQRIWDSASNNLPNILLAGSFNIASSYLLVEALRLTEASKVVGIYQAMTILSVIYGIFVLKEREKMYRKIIGTIIVILGIILTVV